MSGLRLAAAVMLAVGVAACSSTTQLSARAPAGSVAAAGDRTGVAPVPTAGGDAVEGTTPGGMAPGTASGPPGSTPRRGSLRPSDASSGGGGPTKGPGGAAGTVVIGAHVGEDLNKTVTAVGGAPSIPDEKVVVRAVVEYINAHGGMGGRDVTVVFHSTDIAQGTFESQAQAACATFTEDNQVLAVTNSPSGVGGSEVLPACLSAAGTVLLDHGLFLYDTTHFQRYVPYLYLPGHMTPQRWGPALVDGLVEGRYFDRGFKLGLVRPDSESYARAASAVEARLAHHGHAVTSEATVSPTTGLSDFGAVGAELSNVILRFRAAGVTHVIVLDSVSAFLLPQEAESQGWRPRYGVGSMNLPGSMVGFSPPAQLASAVLVGWQPPWDVGTATAPEADDRSDALHRLCMDLAARAGANPPTNRVYVEAHCGALFLLKAALDSGVEPTPEGIRAGVEALGSSWTSPFTTASRFGPGRYDAPAAVRLGHYDAEKDYFVYDTAPIGVP